jgi:hypothetical protein
VCRVDEQESSQCRTSLGRAALLEQSPTVLLDLFMQGNCQQSDEVQKGDGAHSHAKCSAARSSTWKNKDCPSQVQSTPPRDSTMLSACIFTENPLAYIGHQSKGPVALAWNAVCPLHTFSTYFALSLRTIYHCLLGGSPGCMHAHSLLSHCTYTCLHYDSTMLPPSSTAHQHGK